MGTLKSAQLLSTLLALATGDRCWLGYLPYLIGQAVACLILTVSIIAVGVLWNKIEQYAQAMTQGTIDEITIDMGICIGTLFLWKLCNWYSLFSVAEHCHALRTATDEDFDDQLSTGVSSA